MEIVERYIYAVTRRLPEKQREDIEKELRGRIYVWNISCTCSRVCGDTHDEYCCTF